MKKCLVSFTGLILISCSPWIKAGPILYYDIAGAPNGIYSLVPKYLDGAQAALSASSLNAVGINLSDDSDLGSVGDFIFDGWTGDWWTSRNKNQYFGFDITANQPIALNEMRYTFFSGLWSDRGSIRRMQVYASLDGFATEKFVAEHSWFPQTNPFIQDNPNDFVDDYAWRASNRPNTLHTLLPI